MISITDKSQCCGCSACAQRCPKQCISMERDEEGFHYPQVDATKCINCHLCEIVCPVINQNDKRNPLEVIALKNPDEKVRLESSSGGIFTLLAERTIDESGVVFGVCWDEEWNVKHDYAESKDKLQKFRSSKYLQSVIGDSYQKAESFLKAGRKVIFTGTPCQIAGLKHFLHKEYDNLLAVEVICHSVPSPGIWQAYLSAKLQTLNWTKSDIRHISFRNKKTGWKKYSFYIENMNGNVYMELSCKNAFMRGFLADLYTRLSCQACPAKELKSGSDITLGDYWGIGSVNPELDDDKGVSAVVVNTEKGKVALCAIGNIEFTPMTWSDLTKKNPALIRSVSASKYRKVFYEHDGNSFEEKIHVLCRRSTNVRRIICKMLRLLHLR